MRQSARLSIHLASAIQAVAGEQGTEPTLTELVRAANAVHLDGSDLRLRKWLEAFGQQSAWAMTSEQLELAARAMREHGYAPASVNRDLSSLGSVFRWAEARLEATEASLRRRPGPSPAFASN